MLHYLQSVSFEINRDCPLAELHAGVCPISVEERYDNCDQSRTLTDAVILESVDALYNTLNFRGWINWHYFNDPAMEFDRIEALIPQLRALSPKVRISLFTNGIFLPEDLTRCKCFDKIWLKDYVGTRDWTVLKQLRMDLYYEAHPRLDHRLLCGSDPNPGATKCNRMFDEMIIDYYGYGRICTDDWLRKVDIGNVWDDKITGVAAKFVAVRSTIRTTPMHPDAPEHCKRCACPDKFQQCIIDPAIWQECQRWGGV